MGEKVVWQAGTSPNKVAILTPSKVSFKTKGINRDRISTW